MGCFKSSFSLASLDQYISIVFIISTATDRALLDKQLKAEGIPFLRLDREYQLSGIGQLRTRVQAFLESVEGGKQ